MPKIAYKRMLILDRYLLNRFLVPFAYCLAAFLLIIMIYDFSINLEDFIEGRVRLDIILEYFAYSIPIRITEVVPMASLLSILYSIGQLKRHNEITAFAASGISNLRLMMPFLCAGALLSLSVLMINETVVPRCRQRIAKIESVYMKKGDEGKAGAKNKVFAFYNVKSQRSWVGVWSPSEKKALRVEIREFDNKERIIRKITAETARNVSGGWDLSDVKEVSYEGEMLSQGRARTYAQGAFDFPETVTDILDSQKDPQFMTLVELRKHVRIHPKHSRVYHEEKVEYYHKWAYPLLNLLVMLMGVPIGLASDKGHFLMGIGTCMGLFVAYYAVNLLSLTLGKNEVIPPLLGAWLPTLLFLGVGLFLLRKTK